MFDINYTDGSLKKLTSNNKNEESSDYSANKSPKKEKNRVIFTPHWFKNDEYKEKTKVTWEDKYKEMTEVHWRMEVYEKRISDDEIPDVYHPGMIPGIEVKKDPLNETLKEKRLLKRYTMVQEEQIKPQFWPPRIYDKTMKQLNEFESTQLLRQIEKLSEPVDIDDFDEPRVKKDVQQKRIEGRHTIVLSQLDFETENESDFTQWSDAYF
ncbi:hypothetical protein TVAG_466740 [Trichomonas vaginalis G3]|uniref:Uncharacterized protein n=1 Tax=Trichomonas vaginalis (strain ATCC PRA-98 / G3) TaxID=412133 RepID=A2FLA0_TRIV3|nr:hypothetical protein TVAGG3_0384320 [Trichomonas vaginalis G3]EAX94316.1 hypothetical protein TVAG_466740 [Trichomonas vaginalis G3]KAI5533513.1 hypothetical protein TVAGG3_0384320 [Trichomonas vaginalis G3]|eukprot:XP_001307246.1 hypothetical protein [Trichomonas vaginalis G3]